jgi:phage tail P2-like protein
MSTTLRSSQLIQLATPSISYDRQVQAGCGAFDEQMYEIIDETDGVDPPPTSQLSPPTPPSTISEIIFIPLIRQLSDPNLVDILAWQFHVDFYDSTKDLEFRRQLVFNSIQWHMRKGTPDLLQEVLDTFWPGGATLQEWFEYDDPFPPNYPVVVPDALAFTFAPSDVNPAQDKFNKVAHGLTVDTQIKFVKTGTALPAPLLEDVVYYVVDVTANSFRVTLVEGSTALDITSSGSGTNELWKAGGDWHDRYRFRALIDITIIPPSEEAKVVQLINAYKPVSRWFDGFFAAETSTCDIAWYGAMLEFIYIESDAPDYTPPLPPIP